MIHASIMVMIVIILLLIVDTLRQEIHLCIQLALCRLLGQGDSINLFIETGLLFVHIHELLNLTYSIHVR